MIFMLFPPIFDAQQAFGLRIVGAARRQLVRPADYTPGYFKIPYPNGDIDPSKGVCTDVVIRALRGCGLDLQKAIYVDAGAHPKRYPRIKGRNRNIDHRRVPNQAAYFASHGWTLAKDRDFQAGDFVWWKLSSGLDHIGIVSDRLGPSGRPMAIHNINRTAEEDVLTKWTIFAHYRLAKARR